jgi:hypothetical protein
MSADKWMTAGIREMLEFGAGQISARKLDLFNLWCCNILRPYLTDRRSIAAARFAERHVDDPDDRDERSTMFEAARQAVIDLTTWATTAPTSAEIRKRRVYWHAALVAQQTVSKDLPKGKELPNRGVLSNSKYTAYVFGWANDDGRDSFLNPEEGNDGLREVHLRQQEAIFREIVGNPFQPVEFEPRWRTSDVVALARGIYDEKAFTRMPILSDALMDAGCEDETIIGHCRTSATHVRGCWLIDLILQNP